MIQKKKKKNKNNSEQYKIHSTTSSLNLKFDNILILDEEFDENSLNKECKKENEEKNSKIKIEKFNISNDVNENNELRNLKKKINKTVILEEKNENNNTQYKIHSTTSSLNLKLDNILILDDEFDKNSLNKECKKENEEKDSKSKIEICEIIDIFYYEEEIDENNKVINNVFLSKKKNSYSN